MKKLISALVISAAISSPVFAEKQHNHGDGKQGGMMMGMMSHEQMMAMHDHMQKMHDTMAKIRNEADPDKRQKLMQEHMDEMQKGMHMMNQGMNMGEHKKEGVVEKMDEKAMMKRMNMMEQRLNMIQMMMGQMMEHESESKKAPRHRHKK